MASAPLYGTAPLHGTGPSDQLHGSTPTLPAASLSPSLSTPVSAPVLVGAAELSSGSQQPGQESAAAPPAPAAPVSSPTTCLQHGIWKPKIYTDGTIRYENLAVLF